MICHKTQHASTRGYRTGISTSGNRHKRTYAHSIPGAVLLALGCCQVHWHDDAASPRPKLFLIAYPTEANGRHECLESVCGSSRVGGTCSAVQRHYTTQRSAPKHSIQRDRVASLIATFSCPYSAKNIGLREA